MLLDHRIVTQRYFFPRRAPLSDGQWSVDVGPAVLACYRREIGAQRTFVHFHGNGEVVADYLPDYADDIADMNLNLLFVEYRGYGGSTGTPLLGSMLGDVSTVLQQLGKAAENLIVYGRSVGSIFAIEAAWRFPGIRGLVLESGIADPLQRLLLRMEPFELGVSPEEFRAQVTRHLDHQAKLSTYQGRLLVMHAEDDELVPVEHARANHEWAGTPEKRLLLFPTGGHNEIMAANWPAYMGALRRFVNG